jgi:hypothetical protein
MTRHNRDKSKLTQRAKTTEAKLENTQGLPLHACKLPLNTYSSPWTKSCQTRQETEQLLQLGSDRSDWFRASVRPVSNIWTGHPPLIGQTGDLDQSDWWPTEPRFCSKPPKNHLNASISTFPSQTSPLVANAWIKAKIGKNATYSFSTRQSSPQDATHDQTSKLDTR